MAEKRRRLAYVALALAAVPVLGWLTLPWPVAYRWANPSATAVMRYRVAQAERAGEALELRHEWVPLERISARMVRSVISAEDGRFREHGGVDWRALADEVDWQGDDDFSWREAEDRAALIAAARFYRDNRDAVRGRSTITQQLAKNLYFTPERSIVRKAAEMFIARRLELFMSKDRILELYLNTVELGPGLFGVEAAAQEYFGVSAAELTSFQAASLAGTLPHPLTSNPDHRPGRMAARRDMILARLSGGGGGGASIPAAPEPLAAPGLEVPEPPAPAEVEAGAEAEAGPEVDAGAEAEAGLPEEAPTEAPPAGEPGEPPAEPEAPGTDAPAEPPTPDTVGMALALLVATSTEIP